MTMALIGPGSFGISTKVTLICDLANLRMLAGSGSQECCTHMRRYFGHAVLALAGLAVLAIGLTSAGSAAPAAHPASPSVKVAWVGRRRFRLTSPPPQHVPPNPFPPTPHPPIPPPATPHSDLT